MSRLLAMVPPPDDPKYTGTPEQWPIVEAHLGTALPEDYKQIISHYGNGRFGNYLGLFNPFVNDLPDYYDNALDNYVHSLASLTKFIAEGKKEFPEEYPPFDFYPYGNVVMLGSTDDTGHISWYRDSGGDHIVCTDADCSPNFGYYRRSLSQFIVSWLDGSLQPYGFRSTLTSSDKLRFVKLPG